MEDASAIAAATNRKWKTSGRPVRGTRRGGACCRR